MEKKDEVIEVSREKWHRIFRELGLGLEATFNKWDLFSFNPDFSFQNLVNEKSPLVRKIHYPAHVVGNMNNGTGRMDLTFIPWFDLEKLVYRRLCLNITPMGRWGRNFRWMRFARLGEEKAFWFDPAKPPYINLDFLGKTKEFNPVFVKIQDDDSSIHQFVISAADGAGGFVSVVAQRIEEKELPTHLASCKPDLVK